MCNIILHEYAFQEPRDSSTRYGCVNDRKSNHCNCQDLIDIARQHPQLNDLDTADPLSKLLSSWDISRTEQRIW